MNLPLFLSIVGIVDISYLITTRLRKKKPFCIIGQNCSRVLDSKYGKLLGVKNEFVGLAYYLTIFAFSLSIKVPSLVYYLSTLALLASILLLVIQIKILKNFCSH